jgi:hypothetical protein
MTEETEVTEVTEETEERAMSHERWMAQGQTCVVVRGKQLDEWLLQRGLSME